MVAARLVLLLVALSLAAMPGTAAAAPAPGSAVCTAADAALAKGDIEKAREGYVDVVASDPAASCATEGLARVQAASHAEERLCKEGDELTKAGMTEEAQRRYVAALGQNSSSACAIKGLGGGKAADDSKKSEIEKTEGDVTAAGKIAGTIIIGVLVLVGFLLLLLVFWRRRKPSLSIEAFGDDAVDAKVGGLVAGLVQKRLIELSRRGKRAGDGYQLDVVLADVELLAGNESLKETLGGLGEASQLTLVVALLGLVDKLRGKHYVVKGDLAPAGGEGPGVVLALHSQKNGLQAQGAIWAPPPPPPKAEVVEVDEDEDVEAGAEAEENEDVKDDPTPFYGLAGQASAWVQYEAARSLDGRVEVLTKSALSFSLMSQGLAAQRDGRLSLAAELYAKALAADRENVAALVNLSVIFARYEGLYLASLLLLIKASGVLASHYEATGE